MTEYEITTHPDGKQFIRIEDKWMPVSEMASVYKDHLDNLAMLKSMAAQHQAWYDQAYEAMKAEYDSNAAARLAP